MYTINNLQSAQGTIPQFSLALASVGSSMLCNLVANQLADSEPFSCLSAAAELQYPDPVEEA